MIETTSVHVFVDGRVQGVGFRYFVKELASQLSLTGWVRNLEDGRVEILAEGEKNNILEFIDHVRIGPRNAFVSDFRFEWLSPTSHYQYFMIVPTG